MINGNFHNYYQFNKPKDRLDLLENYIDKIKNNSKEQKPFLILDVGCNEGDLTFELFQMITKVDEKRTVILGIDLDQVLIERAIRKNQQKENIQFQVLNVMEEDVMQRLQDFLLQYGKVKFDLVMCFSITMWIHILDC